jgi:outer membrane immunogenic protein
MKKLLSLAAATAALTTGALAADLPSRRPVFAPPPAFSWNGCYIGVNVGAIRDDTNAFLIPSGFYTNPAGGAAPVNVGGTGLLQGDVVTSRYNLDDTGWTGGAQWGCNYQTAGILVFGVESDIQWSGVNSREFGTFGTRPSANPAFTIQSRTETVTSDLNWFSTFRGRAGVALDRLYVYATGGVAWGDHRSSTAVTFATGGGPAFVYDGAAHFGSRSDTRFGGVVGGGVEYAFWNNLSVKAEYLYLSWQGEKHYAPLVAPPGINPRYLWTTTVQPNDHVVRIGLNWRFGSLW